MTAGRACVIGAGSSGLATLKMLVAAGIDVVALEQGRHVGGNWRYEDEGGASAAYASLRCNVSRLRMQYPSFPMPPSFGDYPHHADMASYFDAYADAFDLRRRIRFRTSVERIEPTADGWWQVVLAGGVAERYRVVVVATGHHRAPRWPEMPGTVTVPITHAHDYRRPDAFAGRRVLVVGAGQSAVEIATEVCRVAGRTIMSVRSGTHVLPRYVLGRPLDALDVSVVNRLPWRVLNRLSATLVRLEQRDDLARYGFPRPRHRLIENTPVLSSDLPALLRAGAIVVRPGIRCIDGGTVTFGDGTIENVDHVVCATGYHVRFPFLPATLLDPQGTAVPLYRRIVPPGLRGLYFIGLVDAPTGLLPIVERQSAWLADVLTERIVLPTREAMLAAIDAGERRSRERFPSEPRHSIRCDPHAYLRLLSRDRRRARLRRLLPGASWTTPVRRCVGDGTIDERRRSPLGASIVG